MHQACMWLDPLTRNNLSLDYSHFSFRIHTHCWEDIELCKIYRRVVEEKNGRDGEGRVAGFLALYHLHPYHDTPRDCIPPWYPKRPSPSVWKWPPRCSKQSKTIHLSFRATILYGYTMSVLGYYLYERSAGHLYWKGAITIHHRSLL